MKKLIELKTAVQQGLQLIKQDKSLLEGVIYASSNHRTVGRICYTTHIPSNGLQEPKSDEDFGISVEVWFRRGNKKLLGFGQEPNDLSIDALKRALAKAKRDAVEDPDFTGFLKHEDFPKKYSVPKNYHDQKLMNISYKDEAKLLAKMGWETIRGATDTLVTEHWSPNTAFILNGDNFLIRERMCVGSTNGIFDTDETTVVLSFLTAMIENKNAKGSAWKAGSKLNLQDAYATGKQAVAAACKQIGGQRVKSGTYSVVFGPQAVTELVGGLFINHLNLAMVDFGASLYLGKFGQQITSPLLNLFDDATIANAAGTKKITCEGRPTEKTELIKDGVLVGYLSDSKIRNKVLRRFVESKAKIGIEPSKIWEALAPKNGYRFSRGGGRVASSNVGISATNLVVDSTKPKSLDQILKAVNNGLYIGRLWYTYPVGGYSSGIISGTAIADNFIIKNGKIDKPILPNTLRLEDNIGEMMKNIIAVGNKRTQTILWASDEITHAPLVAIKSVNLKEIAKN